MLNAYYKSSNVSGGTGGGGEAPTASFQNPVDPHVYQSIAFVSTSGGYGLTYQWYIDGSDHGNAQSFFKVFTSPGNHYVTLTVSNDYGSDTESKTIYISA